MKLFLKKIYKSMTDSRHGWKIALAAILYPFAIIPDELEEPISIAVSAIFLLITVILSRKSKIKNIPDASLRLNSRLILGLMLISSPFFEKDLLRITIQYSLFVFFLEFMPFLKKIFAKNKNVFIILETAISAMFAMVCMHAVLMALRVLPFLVVYIFGIEIKI